MSGEQKQTVVDDTNDEAKPSSAKSADAQGNEADLDSLLSEFEARGGEGSNDAGDKPAPKNSNPEKKPEGDSELLDMVKRLSDRDKAREKIEFEQKFNADMSKVVKSIRGEFDPDIFDDDMIEAWVEAQAKKNPMLANAWLHRDAKPKEFGKVVEALGKNFAKKFSKLHDKQATEDREAVTAAVRGTSTKAPDAKAPDFKSMTDAEFAADIEKKHGFRPLV